MRPHCSQVFALPNRYLAYAHLGGIRERLSKKSIGFGGAFPRGEVIRSVEERRIYLLVFDEIRNLDDLCALDRDFLEVLVGQLDVLVLLVLIAFHDLFIGQDLAFELANVLVADPGVVGLVKKVKYCALAPGSRIDRDRDVDEPELYAAAPDWLHFDLVLLSIRAAHRGSPQRR